MNKAQKERFERAGWKVGAAGELLGLTEAEEALVEAKLELAAVIRTLRRRRRLSQAALARLIGSSQPRIAKLENWDPEVSLDLQMKALFAANPRARVDFRGLIRKWGKEPRALPGATAEMPGGARGR